MDETCPVCREELPGESEHCPRCGFPTALLPLLDGPVEVAETSSSDVEPTALVEPAPARRETTPEAEVNASIAHGLVERAELLRTVDRDAPDVTGELCEAALSEAAGRVADAQQILRSAQGRLDRETEELLSRHISDLEARGKALESTGMRLGLEDELGRVAESVVVGEPGASVAALLAAERRVGRLEADWRGLQALIAQVMTLRTEAEQLGIELPAGTDRLDAARQRLASLPADERALDLAAQAAAEALMTLHEAIPPALQAELARHRAALERHPARHSRAQAARRLHAEAGQHLSEGHLENAVESVRALRAVLGDLAREAKEAEEAAARAPPPTPRAPPAPAARPTPTVPTEAPPRAPAVETPSPATPPPGPDREGAAPSPAGGAPPAAPPPTPATVGAGPDVAPAPEAVAQLLAKARSLAARVRTLPAESPEAVDAGRQIREATELLRARRFAEANEALTRLMRSLPPPPSRS
ncbi:MAG TPA: hypothetical protein VMH49_06655 [Thermoplasmata archaeon]|nr:hypothetical protein [Thermoplasmata archaeon]